MKPRDGDLIVEKSLPSIISLKLNGMALNSIFIQHQSEMSLMKYITIDIMAIHRKFIRLVNCNSVVDGLKTFLFRETLLTTGGRFIIAENSLISRYQRLNQVDISPLVFIRSESFLTQSLTQSHIHRISEHWCC